MTDAEAAQMAMNGKVFALEAMLVQTVWALAMSQPHPPTVLSKWLRPLEEQIAKMQADPGNHPVAMETARETIQGVGQLLERTLHEEALRRATPEGSGRG